MLVKCLKVKAEDGEKVLEKLRKLDLRLSNFKIVQKGDYLLIPIKTGVDSDLAKKVTHVDIIECDLKAKFEKRKLAEYLSRRIPEDLMAYVPRSFDIIGHVAVISLPHQLETYASTIGQALIEIHKNVKTVLAKQTPIAGKFRLREYKLIAGEDKTETVHQEYGCRFLIDVGKAYFNPRLSNEHYRVAKSVKEGETIVDMFAGVGPFSILTAKLHENVKIYAIDSNPDAIKYLKKNISLNKVEDKVFAIWADAKNVTDKIGRADRIIMNLPERSSEYIDTACKIINEKGIVHYYCFVSEPDPELKASDEIGKALLACGKKGETIFSKKIKEIAPRTWMVAVDFACQG